VTEKINPGSFTAVVTRQNAIMLFKKTLLKRVL